MKACLGKRSRRIVTYFLTFVMAFALLSIPGSLGRGVNAAPGGSEDDYLFQLVPEEKTHVYDYQMAYYDDGNSVLLRVDVTPMIDESQYMPGINGVVGDMSWTLFNEINDADKNMTVLEFRGNTQFNTGAKSGNMVVSIVEKASPTNVVGKVTIPITYFDSSVLHTVTFDGNGGYVGTQIIGDDTDPSFITEKDESIKEGSTIGADVLKNINPSYPNNEKIFVGWQINGEGDIYYHTVVPGRKWVGSIPVNTDITVTAVWEDMVTLTFITESGTISYADALKANLISNDNNTSLKFGVAKGNTLGGGVSAENDNLYFLGWRCSVDDILYEAGSIYNYQPENDATFTAEWDQIYKITFRSEEGYIGGNKNTVQVVRKCRQGSRFGEGGPAYGSPRMSGYDDYVFDCWVDQSTGEEWTTRNLNYGLDGKAFYPTQDTVMLAKWKPAHNWVVDEVLLEATCTSDGEQRLRCTDEGCSMTKIEVIPATGHKVVVDKAVSPTKTSTGLTAGSHCATCGTVLKAQIIIPKLTDESSGETPGQGNASGNNASNGSGSGQNGNSQAKATSYRNEWVDGKWYNAQGICDYDGTLMWKQNSTGWWVEDSKGWYPISQWMKIDGIWYYFNAAGYMAAGEWYEGYWLNADGSCTYGGVGSWKSDATGWWFADTSGWYAASQWQRIDGCWYYFGSNGYMVTNQYVEGYWIDADGVCR